jgi:outer membrane lipoprotein-sorting protein
MVSPWKSQAYQKWFLSRCNKDFKVVWLYFFLFPLVGRALPPKLPPGLQAFLTRLQKGVLWTGHFKQTDTLPGGSVRVSNGVVSLSTPLLIRFETKKPDPQLLIGNGKKYSIYTPPFDKGEKGQLLTLPVDAPQTKWAHLLLGGQLLAEEFESIHFQNGGYVLKPKPGKLGGLLRMECVLKGRPLMMQKLSLEYRSKNKTVLEFSDFQYPRSFTAQYFEFTPPPGVEIEVMPAP